MDKSNFAMGHRRLESLDLLRGVVMFLLVFLQPVIVAVASAAGVPWLDAVAWHFDHEQWEGFRLWDLVMPLFLFMTGVSVPFSLGRYRRSGAGAAVWRKIFRRVLILWLLGMVVQGNLLAFDPDRIYLYSNTLQAIAIGYLIASAAFLLMSTRGQCVLWLVLLVAYWAPMTLAGDFTPDGNLAELIDRTVLGRFRDGSFTDADGVRRFSDDYHYTWILSSLTFGVTVLTGSLCGQFLKKGRERGAHTAAVLFGAGVAMTAGGWALGFQMPVVKRLWTSSMTLLSAGYCVMLLATVYYLVDVAGRRRGTAWLKVYGMNSIAAYILGECINFRSVAHSVFHGFAQFMGEYYDAWLTFANFAIVFAILFVMHRRGVHLKI